MSSRFPGPLGVVLSQVPRAGDGHVRATVSGGNPSLRSGLTARASVHALRASAAKGFHCRRGETVTLDSIGSSPSARVFEWSFVAGALPVVKTGQLYTPDNPPPGRRVEGRKSGRQVKVVALESFTATLVVKDGTSESAPTPIEVRVQPREWKTSFLQRPQEKTFAKFYSANALLERHGGENACTECGPDVEYGHWIHRDKSGLDWKSQFGIQQVVDPGGPFDGLWYVAKADLRIDRTMYINSELTSGQVFRLNNAASAPPEYRENLKARIACTRLHEKLHGDLVREALARPDTDPAPRVERLIGEDEASLAEQANTEVALKESVLSDASTGPEGHGALRERLRQAFPVSNVKLLLPADRTDTKGVSVDVDFLLFSD